MRLPAKWIFVTIGGLASLAALTCALSPSLRHAFVAGWEVRELLRFRERFKPENLENVCASDPPHRAVACIHRAILEENRLQYASLTARIYYLSTIVNASNFCRGIARVPAEQVDARLDLLEYLNEQMKALLLKTGGVVDLSPLDSRSTKVGLVEDPEISLRRRYHANLVDLWIKYWRQDHRYLVRNRTQVDVRTQGRLDMMIGDRDELFSRFSIDLTRYAKRRQKMNFQTDDSGAIVIEEERSAAESSPDRTIAGESAETNDSSPSETAAPSPPPPSSIDPVPYGDEDSEEEPRMDAPSGTPVPESPYPWAAPTDSP